MTDFDLKMSNNDELTMRLIHYLITKENYQPIVVNGLKDEIWLENPERYYKVVRISNNYIHNDEQFDYDMFKIETIIKQIRKKLLAINCYTLNICLNFGAALSKYKYSTREIETLFLDPATSIHESEELTSIFPEIINDDIEYDGDIDFFINITNDINQATEKRSALYQKIFSRKKIIVTYILIAINILIFLLQMMGLVNVNDFATSAYAIRNHNFWVLITAAFLHADIIHLACNMYSLYVVGTQVENVFGKKKFLAIYFISAIASSLASGVLTKGASIGASGAIFGLLGALMFFGYHYRLYFGDIMRSQLIPIIILNLGVGFLLPGVDNFGHIGGLIGGVFASMLVGIEGRTEKEDRINGAIVLIVLFIFLLWMILK